MNTETLQAILTAQLADQVTPFFTSAMPVTIDPSRMPSSFMWSADGPEDRRFQQRAVWAAMANIPTLDPRRLPASSVPMSAVPTATLEEIHAAFDSAAEDAVSEAHRILEDARLKRAERLKALGFSSAADVREVAPLLDKVEIGKRIAPLVVAYERKYQKKFITEAQVEFLAKKYNLVFGPAKRFRGQVPEENLAEIETFMKKAPTKPPRTEMMMVAPYSDFDTRGYAVRDNKMVYDPIVLHPVKGGFLIVTAWGEEAKDELVQRTAGGNPQSGKQEPAF